MSIRVCFRACGAELLTEWNLSLSGFQSLARTYLQTLMNRKIRMAYVVSHPIQYQAPLLRLLAKQPDLDLRVFFFHETTAGLHNDLGFSQEIAWDVSLVEGYSHESLRAGKYLGGIWHGSLKNRLCSGEFPIVWLHGYNHPTFLRIIGLAA